MTYKDSKIKKLSIILYEKLFIFYNKKRFVTIVTPPVKLLRNFEQGECQRFNVQKYIFLSLYHKNQKKSRKTKCEELHEFKY